MATVTGKRKRETVFDKNVRFKKLASVGEKKKISRPRQPKAKFADHDDDEVTSAATNGLNGNDLDENVTVQIVTGSYERVLHGISASIPSRLRREKPSLVAKGQNGSEATSQDVAFSDTFLFAAHSSSIRCLAISPPTEDSGKRILATGSSDERINLYNLSTAPTTPKQKALLPALSGAPTAENPRNRSLGSLVHHDRPITSLQFPTRSKLFTAAEDNTIAISRTRDWTVLSSIKAPIPKPQGRPSGDTAGPGEVPAGVNDFAIHPSQKLMLSVSRGEKCMRLWNLMTGKKAGVLNFQREVLSQVGEGKYSSGEGRRVLWDEAGEIYVTGFERGAIVFGVDSKPKAIIKAERPTKLHQMRFLPRDTESQSNVLAVSTEDGRILFFNVETGNEDTDARELPLCPCIAQVGGRTSGFTGRIKDFEILQLSSTVSGEETPPLLFITGSSDGAIRLWTVFASELEVLRNTPGASKTDGVTKQQQPQTVGTLIGTLETGNRITCLGAFVMDGKTVNEDADEAAGAEEEVESSEEDSE